MEPETISISKFKATCLAVLDDVRTTGRSVIVTRRGTPVAEIIPPAPHATVRSWLGSAADSGHIVGDIVAPAVAEVEWEAVHG